MLVDMDFGKLLFKRNRFYIICLRLINHNRHILSQQNIHLNIIDNLWDNNELLEVSLENDHRILHIVYTWICIFILVVNIEFLQKRHGTVSLAFTHPNQNVRFCLKMPRGALVIKIFFLKARRSIIDLIKGYLFDNEGSRNVP